MKYKSKVRLDEKGYIEYLDSEHREHVLLDEKWIKEVKKWNLHVDLWYNINIKEDKDSIKEMVKC